MGIQRLYQNAVVMCFDLKFYALYPTKCIWVFIVSHRMKSVCFHEQN